MTVSATGEAARRSTATARVVDAGTAGFVVLAAIWIFTTPLRHPDNLMAYAQDDLYYYLVAARNLATGHGSTFDGTTLTNGYHPLYFLVFWAMYHFISQMTGIFRFLSVLDVASAVTIFLAARALLARRLKDVWLINGLALATVSVCLPKLQHQMEVTLTLPLVLVFLYMLDEPPERLCGRTWFGAGVIGALMVLSRLDSVLLVVMLGAATLAVPQYRRALGLHKFVAFLVGFLPLLLAYVLSNEVFFHRLSPISGAAKQLKVTPGFAWNGLFEHPGSCFTLLVIALILVLMVIFRKQFAKEQLVVYSAALSFPVAHWFLELWSSDWKVWPWYTYSLRPAMLVAFLLAGVVLTRRSSALVQQGVGMLVFVVFLALIAVHKVPPEKVMTDVYSASVGISDFAKTHPGRYAMGDRAGMAGYLIGQPMVQTEGLMMDNAYLEHMRRQEPLRDVLKAYDVDYYVGFSEHKTPAWKPVEGCFEAREPAQAGPNSPSMRGEFCEKPAWVLIQKSGETMIFDLRGEHQGSEHHGLALTTAVHP